MIMILIFASIQFSLARVLCLYCLPYLVINMWLTIYTWLQHTDNNIPHFSNETWSWSKGALQTVDRPYGPVLNFLQRKTQTEEGGIWQTEKAEKKAKKNERLIG